MKQPTVTSFFLGANSASGFYSLYDHFCSAPSDTLHIIKSGPGTGKSTFMRRIGRAAEEHGLDVEYILCSGDPDSLDGVYIPALHTGWVDGTAPHVIEPSLFGAAAEYVNLGQFCNTTLLRECRELIGTVSAQYKSHYAAAYTYLHAAGAVYCHHTKSISPDAEQKLRKRAHAKICRDLGKHNTHAAPTKRFLRAISCQGNYFPAGTVNVLCQKLCALESHNGLEQIFFHEILSEITDQGAQCIICPSPLCPDLIEAVILQAEQIGFVASYAIPPFDGTLRTIHLDSYLSEYNPKECKKQEQLCSAMINTALAELAQAKQLHDELETYYRPALDTKALNDYTESVIQTLFQ